MPRYIRQRDTYGCGPIAMMNAFKWAGFHFSYSELKPLFYALARCGYPDGCSPRYLDQGLRGLNEIWGSPLKITRRYHVTKKEVDRRLDQGEAVILLTGRKPSLYGFSEGGAEADASFFWGHYVFVPRKAGASYIVVNDARESDWEHVTTYRAPNRRMRKMLRHYSDVGALEAYRKKCSYPTAWFLSMR